jgi:hypothetical protein
MANTYETGSTITLRATFSDILDVPTSTDGLPSVTIYDTNFREVGSAFTSEQEGIGQYKLIYSIPQGVESTVYYYEFKGTFGGMVALNRNKFFVRFCN